MTGWGRISVKHAIARVKLEEERDEAHRRMMALFLAVDQFLTLATAENIGALREAALEAERYLRSVHTEEETNA